MGSIVSREELAKLRLDYRSASKKVVFTNGVFDIIHRGHVEYLSKARAMGDVLVVGLNDDASVRRLKGPSRPVNAQDDRAAVLAALIPVNYVCLFSEDTPLRLIEAVLPDVLVKGADWTPDRIVGREIVERSGGKVATVAFVEGKSTTSIIERISGKSP